MAGMSATDIASLELEGVQDVINDLTLDEKQLDTYFNNNRAEQVGTIAYRIVMKWAKPGHFQMGSLDGGTLPTGPGTKWQKGAVTPQVIMLPTGWTKLVELAGKKAPQVAITNVVDEVMNDVTEQLANAREVLLQTDGAGTLGIVSSIDTVNQIYTLNSTPFGTRLLQAGLTVDIVNPANNLRRGSVTLDYNFNFLGSAQTFGYSTANVGGAQANDIVRVQGVTDGAPVGIYGLAYFISTSTQGSTLGVTRANSPFMVSNGYNNGGAQITLPIFRLIINQIKQRIGKRGLKGQFFHTHPSQVASYEELGFQLQMIPLGDGKAKGLDLLFSGEKSVEGYPIVENVRADQLSWYFIQPKAFGKVQYGSGPFWYDTGIGKIYPIIDGSTGTPKTAFGATMIDPRQYFCDNLVAQAVISQCGVPVGN